MPLKSCPFGSLPSECFVFLIERNLWNCLEYKMHANYTLLRERYPYPLA